MKHILLFTILCIVFTARDPLKAQSDARAIGKQYFDMGEYFRWANAIDGNGDLQKALVSYQKSANLNYPDGIAALGEMVEFGLGGLQKDELKAFSLYKKAYDLGSGRACYCMARSYAYGIACEIDYKKMIAFLQKGIERGDRTSIYGMGDMLYKGWGIEQSYENAIPYFEKASAMGCASSKYYLGICYRNGYGVVKDEQKGMEYLKNAAKIYSYADKELKRVQPETVAAKKIRNKEHDSPQSFVKTKHTVKQESLAGEWTGYLSYYDWSGKIKLNEQEVKLTIKTQGDKFEGTWAQDGATFNINGFNNKYGIVFNSGEYDCIDHYMGRVKLKINTGTFESFSLKEKTFLAGNISLFSITEKSPERPAYLLLSRVIQKKDAKIEEDTISTLKAQQIVAPIKPVNNLSSQTIPAYQIQPSKQIQPAAPIQPSTQMQTQALVTDQSETKSIDEWIQDKIIKSRVWPVPFNNQISVEYNLRASCEVEIRLLNMSGILIEILAKEKRQAGLQTQNFEVSVKPGAYVLQIVSDDLKEAHVIIKK